MATGVLPDFEVTRRRGQKNLYLRIRGDGKVIVSAPSHLPDRQIEAFVRDRSEWLARRLAHRAEHARPEPDGFGEDLSLWYLGRAYPLRHVEASRNGVSFDGTAFLFRGQAGEPFLGALRRFYLREARRYIADRVAFWSERMGLKPKALRFRRYKSRWGCCAPDNTLSFNTALMRYDPELIDYVVVHELAHIRHKNHGPAFWALVARHMPDFKSLRKRLV